MYMHMYMHMHMHTNMYMYMYMYNVYMYMYMHMHMYMQGETSMYLGRPHLDEFLEAELVGAVLVGIEKVLSADGHHIVHVVFPLALLIVCRGLQSECTTSHTSSDVGVGCLASCAGEREVVGGGMAPREMARTCCFFLGFAVAVARLSLSSITCFSSPSRISAASDSSWRRWSASSRSSRDCEGEGGAGMDGGKGSGGVCRRGQA